MSAMASRGALSRHLVLAAGSLLLASCARDTSLPPPPAPPGPGTLYGHVVYYLPGNPSAQPAKGTTASILGSGVSTQADDAGFFLLTPVSASTGSVLFRFSSDASGQVTHQVLLDLASTGAGPGRQIALGNVTLSQNAVLHGRALRGDVPGPSGHGGTVVYVPQGPFTTYTADDGSYQLRDLPVGSISLSYFRAGYQTVTMDNIALRPGQDSALPDQSVQVDPTATSVASGSISGQVTFAPPLASAAGTAVVVVDGIGSTITGSITAGGDFSVSSVPPGLYQLTVSHDGYAPVIASNLLLGSGQSLVLPGLVMSALSAPTGPCVAGTTCQLAASPCHVGAVACGAGGASCADTGGFVVDGTPCGGGATCQAGTCSAYCAAGGSCLPLANVCHVGVVTCQGGTGPSCFDTGTSLPNGTPCGVDLACNAGSCTPCAAGGCGGCSVSCVPANPCHLGSQSCVAGSTCADLGSPAADGTACGTNQVCLSGNCTACIAGIGCQPANPCKNGVTSCSGGVSVCAETTSLADFTSCGAPSICRAGVCGLPSATVSTLLRSPTGTTTPLYGPTGLAVAASGDTYVSDTNHHVVRRIDPTGSQTIVAGTLGACGYRGDGGAAQSAQLCSPRGLALDEANGLLYVADYSNAVIRQVQLSGAQLISTFAGGGSAGAPGYGDGGPATAAVLSNPTRVTLARDATSAQSLYIADYSHNRIRRVAVGAGGVPGSISAWLAQDTSCSQPATLYNCGQEMGCAMAFDAQGNAFVSGLFCGTSFGNTTTPGIVRVSASGAVTQVAGFYLGVTTDGVSAHGASFGYAPALALDAAGNLFAADSFRNLVRRIDGASGRIDTVVGTGTASSTGDGGPATSATIQAPWDIAFDPTRRLDLAISETGAQAVRRVVNAGSNALPVAALTAPVPSGNGQSVPVDQQAPTPLTVKLVDGGGAPLAGYPVQFSSLTTGGSISTSVATTGPGGSASAAARVGRVAGAFAYQASFQDIHGVDVGGSPVPFGLTATPAPAGSVTTLVNASGATGNGGLGGPGTLATINHPAGVAMASNGTVYFSDYSNAQVKALGPDGILRLVAGTGTCTYGGDGGAAVQATLCNPRALALDEPNQLLYVADSGNSRVRVVNLQNGTISLVAGGGSAGAPGYGDGGSATVASLSNPYQIALATDPTIPASPVRYLVVADSGHGRVRRVNLGTGVITTLLAQDTSCSQPATFYGCGAEPGCSLAFDASGNGFVSGVYCGSDFGNTTVSGVARVTPAGGLTQIAGRYLGSSSDGVSAHGAALGSSPPALALDAGGNLFLADYSLNRVKRIDGASGRIATVLGNGTASSTGDGGPASAATVDGPFAIGFDGTRRLDLVVVEYGGNTLRFVPAAGSASTGGASLALASGNNQTVPVDQPAAPLQVLLRDGSGVPLSGYGVRFTGLTSGGSLSASLAQTDAAGIASDSARAGRAPVVYSFQASFQDIHGVEVSGSPVAFGVTAAAPAAGTIYNLVNEGGVFGNNGAGGPASLADTNRPTGLAVASDGTVYFSDYANHMVKRVSPTGILTAIAGTGACAFGGDGGPANLATLCGPHGMALDEPGGLLYFADYSNNRIRVVNLATGVISTVAGGGAATGRGFGDGGPATAALLAAPGRLGYALDQSVPPVPYLYIGDTNHGRVRRVNLNTGVISAWLSPDTTCAQAVNLYGCGGDMGCGVIFDGAGNGFVSGQFCGSDFGGNVNGIARISPSGAATQVAGYYLGMLTDGVSAHFATFTNPPGLALDAAGNLYALDYGAHRIRQIDAATGRIVTVIGDGTGATGGDGGPASAATVFGPWEMVFAPPGRVDLYLTEYSGNTVRVAVGEGSTAASSASLALSAGTPQSILVDQVTAPLAVKLADASGAGLPGYLVQFSSGTTGGSVTAPSTSTGVTGIASSGARAGLWPQTYTFQAAFRDIHGNHISGSPVPFAVGAAAPADGVIFTAVDVARASGNTGVGGPGTLATVNAPIAVQIASSGTIYFSDYLNDMVKAVDRYGILTVVAGDGTCASGGDGGPALQASLCYPRGLALDEPNQLLYIADSYYGRVRVVDLTTGIIRLVAGSGSATSAPWGDGGPATSATLNSPVHVRVRGSTLYIADINHQSVRTVNLALATPTISTWLEPATPLTCSGGFAFYNCGTDGCDVAFDSAGTAYVSGYFCGGLTTSGFFGVATYDGNTLTRVVGTTPGTSLSPGGVPQANAFLPSAPVLDFDTGATDPLGRLVLAMPAGDLVGAIDLSGNPASNAFVWAGTGSPGYLGDYVPAVGAQLNQPYEVAFGAGHAAVADYGNHALRLVW